MEIAGLHDKGGNPQRQTGKDDLRRKAEVFSSDLQERFLPAEEADHPDTGESLGNDGGQGRTAYIHVKTEDKNRVQNDIGHRADQNGEHSRLGKSLGSDKRVHAQRELHENSTQSIDIHVTDGVLDGILTCAESHQKIPVPDQQHNGKHHGNNDLKRETVSQNLLCGIPVLLSHENRSPGGPAITHQRRESGDNHDQRHADSHSRQSGGSNSRNMPDVNSVHNIVEHVNQLRRHRGQSQPKQQFAQGLCPQKFLILVRRFLLNLAHDFSLPSIALIVLSNSL